MTKADIIEIVGLTEKLSLKTAEAVVNGIFKTIEDSLARGEKVQISNFGVFEVKNRARRIGRNPRTNEEVVIPARKLPNFRACDALKKTVSGE